MSGNTGAALAVAMAGINSLCSTLEHFATERELAFKESDPKLLDLSIEARLLLDRLGAMVGPASDVVPVAKKYTVIILYPKGSGEYGDTYGTFVEARNRDDAVREAIRECCEQNEWALPDSGTRGEDDPGYDYDDFQEVAVMEGEHPSL